MHIRSKWWREIYETHHRGVKRREGAAERGMRFGFVAPALDRQKTERSMPVSVARIP